jgi:predicted nuclease with TOPRIM domain
MNKAKVVIAVLLALLGVSLSINIALIQKLGDTATNVAEKVIEVREEQSESTKPSKEIPNQKARLGSFADRNSSELKKIKRINSKLNAFLAQSEQDYIAASNELTKEFSGSLSVGEKTRREYELKAAQLKTEVQARKTAEEEVKQILGSMPEIQALQAAGKLPQNLSEVTAVQLEEIENGGQSSQD